MLSCLAASGAEAGSGTRPVIDSASSGQVPQVTIGAIAAAFEAHLAIEGRRRRRSARSATRPPALSQFCALRREGPALRDRRMVVSSGATMPARPPASIDMLQTVSRPSIDRPRMALPAYSMTWPTAPAAPILRDDGRG